MIATARPSRRAARRGPPRWPAPAAAGKTGERGKGGGGGRVEEEK